MPPAVAPGPEVRRAIAQVGGKGGGNFGDGLAQQRRLDDHFAGELHARPLQAQPVEAVAGERAQAAMGVVDARAEQYVEQAGQGRIADVAVLPGHGARLDAALESRAHAEIGATEQLADHRRRFHEIVGAVGVAHHEEAAVGGLEARHERGAIAASRDGNNARTQLAGEGLAAVRAAIVCDHHLAGEAVAFADKIQRRSRAGNAVFQRHRLIEARHHDADIDDVRQDNPQDLRSVGARSAPWEGV